MRNLTLSVLVALGVSSSAAGAVSSPTITRGGGAGHGFSVLSGRTLGADTMVVGGELGFPGLSVGVLRGITSQVDVGARLSFNWGVEGQPNLLVPGFKLQAPIRVALMDSEKLNLGVSFAPGALLYFFSSSVIGLILPLSVVLGVPATDAISIHAAVDLPLWISLTPSRAVTLPLLFGGGLEYLLNQGLALTLKVRMGPSIDFGAMQTRFAVESTVGAALRL